MFSARFAHTTTPNRLTQALQARQATGARVLDLTASNPTQAGLPYDATAILAALADPRALTYQPDPRGLLSARAAVAEHYAARGLAVSPAAVHLTASTSEAYGYLFKLLCDPGDAVLVPRPSYPLFDVLADLERVELVHYPLAYQHRSGWRFDLESLAAAVTPRTRAVIVVHPNNPTGSFVHRDELAALHALCVRHDLALVSDEVFADYTAQGLAADRIRSLLVPDAGEPDAHPRASLGIPLTFVLSGLSKVVALPQLKLGWIHVGGPAPLCRRAQEGLDWIADAYLSVAAPVQHALPRLLALQPSMHSHICARVEQNEHALSRQLSGVPAARLQSREGGWYAVIEVPRRPTDEEWALRLLNEDGVLVQPGYFFDFPGEGHLVVSLLTELGVFTEGAARLAAMLARA